MGAQGGWNLKIQVSVRGTRLTTNALETISLLFLRTTTPRLHLVENLTGTSYPLLSSSKLLSLAIKEIIMMEAVRHHVTVMPDVAIYSSSRLRLHLFKPSGSSQ